MILRKACQYLAQDTPKKSSFWTWLIDNPSPPYSLPSQRRERLRNAGAFLAQRNGWMDGWMNGKTEADD
ncbi:hypothetical protein EYC84_009729 [Monilinia fructicola]|uniref:Uncharacterized protein n=1 Tax=Monilinia fructicola TaxID=38448 RepID=A0A5M9J8H9_MONFR|nr:hypothetical protein EYC84_009729 [Monilinia fructicola]